MCSYELKKKCYALEFDDSVWNVMINSYGICRTPNGNCVPRAAYVTRFPGLPEENCFNDGQGWEGDETPLYIYCHANILSLQKVNAIHIKNYLKVKKKITW